MTAPVPISVFQIRAGFENPDLVLPERQDASIRVEPVRVAGERVGDLYAKVTAPHSPRWLAYLTNHVDLRDLRLRVSSASAVLLMRASNRLYAITFGHGHTLLADSTIESSFGLKVTLNAIDESGVRAIDHKRLDAVTRLTREQLDRESDMMDFGLDVERDLLRAVVGKPRDRTLGTRLAGADRLVVFGGPQLAELQAYLARIGELSSREDYRRAFPWVDNLREVRDSRATNLWNEIVELMGRGQHDSVHLTIPEIIDWHVVDHFRYDTKRDAPQHGDLNLAEYLNERAPDTDDLLSRIEADRVYGWSVAAGEPSKSWSVRRCLTAEIAHDDTVFVLSDGKWYEARRELIAEIEETLRVVSSTRIQLPPYEGSDEDAFNRVASDSSAGRLFLVHPNKVLLERRGSVEPCDLYSSTRAFIHAKRYHGASAMSHLFSQGLVSAELFAQNRLFRGRLNDLLPATHRVPSPDHNPAPTDYEVAYLVLGRDGGALGLPFFSRANLRNALRQFRLMGFNVTVTTLPNIRAASPPPLQTPPARRRRRATG